MKVGIGWTLMQLLNEKVVSYWTNKMIICERLQWKKLEIGNKI